MDELTNKRLERAVGDLADKVANETLAMAVRAIADAIEETLPDMRADFRAAREEAEREQLRGAIAVLERLTATLRKQAERVPV